ncbi:NAD-dependent epimerase/dehydratase family protein [Comamonas piscis]|uniref:NAD-dependent epimerase/dehydratase family protein n=1 Tax=Comamonas piscis TaxID=1562974 RepID=A0A7G5EL50_9BURK|nr:NAD-dependent epimerase/dehydratase family protein [Comamonas piscis]QMV74725.1 NAD-dependent epimerase/dehydratase family protein [Comamonas piscis]WSO33190.1 NAD-dependent epimerase/dehydratase family protein [Comamonas piscis]
MHSPNTPQPTVLLCGGQGFIGQTLARQLRAQGMRVIAASRRSQPPLQLGRMQQPADWLPHLQGVDMVINAVGSLRDQPGPEGASLEALHQTGPQALFEACAQAGVRRVMQLSALGVEDNNTAYARTKRAADSRLLALTAQGQLDGMVVRPSIVMGAQGASTQLFMRLALLPVLVLPAVMQQRLIQPVAVDELAEVMLRLLQSSTTGIVSLGGPKRLSMAQMIDSLRQQAGRSRALQLRLPGWATQASARLGDAVPTSPWCSASLQLASLDNCCDPAPMAQWLGRAPTDPAQMLALIRNPAAPPSHEGRA